MRAIWKKKGSYTKLVNKKLISQIRFEITQIDQLFEVYQELFQKIADGGDLSVVEITATGSVVHSFYNGLENIFTNTAKRLDHSLPTDAQWHRELLLQMGQATSKRMPVLTAESISILNNYRGFRHFYRHSYSFFLDWEELEKLAKPLPALWATIKQELQAFIATLQ